VTNPFGNNVSVIDGTTNKMVEILTVGAYPTGVTYDNRTGEVYVANQYSDTLTYIVVAPPALSPIGPVFWGIILSMVTLGTVGVFFAAWISRTTVRSKHPSH
jgi:YVTN family beta-propeller protein